MTVSRAFNAPERVAPETLQRIRKAVEELGYVPNALARKLQGGRSHSIGLILSSFTNPFNALVAEGVETGATEHNSLVILGTHNNSVEKEKRFVELLIANQVDGVVIKPFGDGSRAALEMLRRKGVPFVVVDVAVEGTPADTIVGDNYQGAYQLTEHLASLGHRRVAFISGPHGMSNVRDRLHGYEAAMRAHGLEPLETADTHFSREDGYRIGLQFLALPAEQRPTAVVAANNNLAAGLLGAVRPAGLRVPEDMALACFDEIELASAMLPFFTVLAQPAHTYGSIAAQFLFEQIANPQDWKPRKVVLPGEMIVRASSGKKI